MKFKKSQITVIEVSFIFILFFGVISFFVVKPCVSEINYQKSIDSVADSIYYSEYFRSIIMDEDLTDSIKTEDWSAFESFMDSILPTYDFVISNVTLSETLYSCDGDFKEFAERIISIKNNDIFEYRTFRIGVCY